MVAQDGPQKQQAIKRIDLESLRVTWEQLLAMLTSLQGKKGVHILVTHKAYGYLPRMSNLDFCQVEGVPILTFHSVPEVLAAGRMLLFTGGTPVLFPELNKHEDLLI